MTKMSKRSLAIALGLALPALNGCGTDNAAKPEGPIVAEPSAAPAPTPGGPQMGGMRGPGMGGGMGGPSSPIKNIMRKVTGKNAFAPQLGTSLAADEPDWAAIQAQTKEYATLAKELGTHEPPKGSKESWTTLTAQFAATAEELDKAAQAKDKPAAITARDTLSNSCMACHSEHQNKRGGFGGGGFGGPGGGRPGGGGPPGGGPPPGGQPPK